ncbi:MAG: VWA domain-containing protein [Syntrophobacterales bacterium]|nr:VWA domain-containing protein [Syntrophobacterales bacterium]
MDRVLEDFITTLRRSGVRISVSESLDAARALQLVGYDDRNLLKNSLSVALAKSAQEKEIFSDCFDRFFSFDFFSEQPLDERSRKESTEGLSDLSRMLMTGDQPGLVTYMKQAARAENLSEIRYQTQKSLYAMRILERMGLSGLDANIRDLYQAGTPSSSATAARLEEARSYLVENVRSYVEEQLLLFSGYEYDKMIEDYLRNIKLSNLEQRYYHQMQGIIQRMVKRLNDLYSRKRKPARRGHLDFKQTIRDNVAYQGLLFNPRWKKVKVEKPNVVAICDISRSVSRLVRFFLLFLYGLNREIINVRSFIFCSNLAEVTDIFEQYPIEEAVARIQAGTDIPVLLARTDYDRTLRDFKERYLDAVTHKTTVLFLGDARNNYNNPQTQILKMLSERCKKLIWLNPETKPFWGTGDSEMLRYAPYCHVLKECNTLNHLERVVQSLLKK